MCLEVQIWANPSQISEHGNWKFMASEKEYDES